MKKLILPILIVLISVLFSSSVLAKNPQDIKLNCPNISSTLRFAGEGKTEDGSDLAYSVCKSGMGGVKAANTIIYLGGEIHIGLPENLPKELSNPNIPDQTRLSPAKTKNLLVGDDGKIYFWGPPWEQGSSGDPYVQYKAKFGNCYLNLWGSIQNDLDIYLKTGVMPDWQIPADFMMGKLSAAAKEIEGQIAEKCGAKNVIDNSRDKNGQQVAKVGKDGNPLEQNFSIIPIFIGEWFQGVSMGIGLQIIEFSDKLQKSMFHQSILLTLTEEELDEYLDTTIFRPAIKAAVRKAKGEDYWPFIKNVEIGEDGKPVLIKTPQGVMQLSPLNGQRGILEYEGGTPVLKSGAIEVLEETGGQNPASYETPNAEIFVIGTEFSVIYDSKKNKTIVAVYKGKVGIKTSDGSTAAISPDGDKPGVVVITQKLSPIKLTIAGAVLAVVIGGGAFLLKRKFIVKGFSKKKR